jgi:hypothetical protein
MPLKEFVRKLACVVAILGCVSCSKAPAPVASQPAAKEPSERIESPTTGTSPAAAAAPKPKRKGSFQPVDLSGDAGGSAARGDAGDDRQSQNVVSALQPFQVLLGQWRWVTKKKFGEFPKTGEGLEWVWDFQTDRKLPALVAHSDEHPYFHQVSLTYIPVDDQFQLTAEEPRGTRRVLRGAWLDGAEPREESDGRKLQRTYKLQLTQVEPSEGEQWQVTLNQLDNNQYLVDLKRKSATGSQFGPLDTVRQQRMGTSFAVADSDNPGPKCIISGGLGTMSVTYKGKSYPVCCSGCAAAFNDDPERWLAKLEKK